MTTLCVVDQQSHLHTNQWRNHPESGVGCRFARRGQWGTAPHSTSLCYRCCTWPQAGQLAGTIQLRADVSGCGSHVLLDPGEVGLFQGDVCLQVSRPLGVRRGSCLDALALFSDTRDLGPVNDVKPSWLPLDHHLLPCTPLCVSQGSLVLLASGHHHVCARDTQQLLFPQCTLIWPCTRRCCCALNALNRADAAVEDRCGLPVGAHELGGQSESSF